MQTNVPGRSGKDGPSHAIGLGPVQSWLRHGGATIVLAVPLIGAQLAQMTMNVTDTVMIGWLGATELAAGVLATQAFFIVYIFGAGFAQAVLPLAAGAEGRGDVRDVRRSIRMGLWVLVLYGAIVMVPLWYTEAILVALGQEPEISALAGAYMRVAQWSMFPALLVLGLRSYLTVVNRAYLVLAVIIVGAFGNAGLNYVLIFGHYGAPALGIVGAAVATLVSNLLMAALLAAYTAMAPSLRRYELYARFWRPDWADFFEVLRLGWPIGATIIAEVGLFAASSIMMGWLGTIPLAAHGIALQIASIAFMVPLGLSSAATVRVGLAFGRGDHRDLDRAAGVALVIGTLIAVGGACLFWFWPQELISLYLDRGNANAEAVLAYGVPLLLVAAVFQIADALQVVAAGILRGVKDTRTPMLIALFSYWLVGMPVAYLLTFVAGWDGQGLWWGLAFGLSTAALLLNGRFLLRDRYGLLATGS